MYDLTPYLDKKILIIIRRMVHCPTCNDTHEEDGLIGFDSIREFISDDYLYRPYEITINKKTIELYDLIDVYKYHEKLEMIFIIRLFTENEIIAAIQKEV
jgi:hypothetical protein